MWRRSRGEVRRQPTSGYRAASGPESREIASPRNRWFPDANAATPLQHVSCALVVRDCRLVIQNTIKPWRPRFLTQSLPPLTYRTICPSWVATDRFGTCKTIIQSRLASQQPSAQPPSAGSRPWPHPQGALILGSTSSSFAEVYRSWSPSPSSPAFSGRLNASWVGSSRQLAGASLDPPGLSAHASAGSVCTPTGSDCSLDIDFHPCEATATR